MLAHDISVKSENWELPEYLRKSAAYLPIGFVQAVAQLGTFAIAEFDREIERHSLFYHTWEHVNGVQQKANTMFQVIRPYWEASLDREIAPIYLARMHLLLDLCALAHDMIQIFLPITEPHTPRRREAGVSEAATLEKLLNYIDTHDTAQKLQPRHRASAAYFTEHDRNLIRQAIEATICAYDPVEQSIYQPSLYEIDSPISPVARIIAIADIGSLSMSGIAAFNREGSLIFLEENPDVIPLLQQGIDTIESDALRENVRQRLLRRARFQISLAKSRYNRLPQELVGFPEAAIPELLRDVFPYLNADIIHELESTTPTADDTSLSTLLEFFQLEQFLSAIAVLS